MAPNDDAEQADGMDASASGGGAHGLTGSTGLSGATNFVLFDFRALTTFDERKPYVLTLAESGSARLLLVMLRAGQTLAPQPLASETSAQALRGRLRLSVGPSVGAASSPDSLATTELRAGRLALIEAHIPYRFDAVSDAVVLLSLTPSPGEAAPDDADDPLRGAAGPLVTRGVS